MKVAMVKHTPAGQVFWFGVPDRFVNDIHPGSRVACDTAWGQNLGVVVGSPLNEKDVKAIAIASGAKFPLRQIVAVATPVPMQDIKISKYMSCTKPRDEKISKRFLEVYHNGEFNTSVVIGKDGVLVDGYSAYLVAKELGLDSIIAIRIENQGGD